MGRAGKTEFVCGCHRQRLLVQRRKTFPCKEKKYIPVNVAGNHGRIQVENSIRTRQPAMVANSCWWAVPTLRHFMGHRLQLFEKIIALVVCQDKGREVLHLDFPDRLHAQFRVVYALHLCDVFFCQQGGRPAD